MKSFFTICDLPYKSSIQQSGFLSTTGSEISPAATRKPEFQTVEEKRKFVRKAYEMLTDSSRSGNADSVMFRVKLIGCLEKLLRTEFKNTRDFRQKVEDFLQGYDGRKMSASRRIRKARKKKKWTQKQLATYLGLKSHVPIVQYEKSQRNPSARVMQWLKEVGM
jgi:ribosome-binding protein aMBF1 (putative translation factor)